MNKTKVQDGRLSLGEKLSYSMGEVATCAMFALFTTLLVFFYTDVVGVPPATGIDRKSVV